MRISSCALFLSFVNIAVTALPAGLYAVPGVCTTTLTTATERRHFNYEKDDSLSVYDHDIRRRELKDDLFASYDYDDRRRELKDDLFAAYDYDDRRRELKESDKDNLPSLSHVFWDHAVCH